MRTDLKAAARRGLEPIAGVLARLGLTANAVTGLGLVVSLASAGFFAAGRLRAGGALLLLSGLCDTLDGALARRTGTVSAFGKFLDSTVDRYADGAVFAGVAAWAALGPEPRTLAFVAAGAALVGAFVVSYARAKAESLGQECAVGLMERPERVLVLAIGALAGPRVLPWALVVLAVGTHVTAVERITHVHRALTRVPGGRAAGKHARRGQLQQEALQQEAGRTIQQGAGPTSPGE